MRDTEYQGFTIRLSAHGATVLTKRMIWRKPIELGTFKKIESAKQYIDERHCNQLASAPVRHGPSERR